MASESISKAIDQAALWLFDLQDNENGGWPGWKGDEVSTLNTAEVILSLLESSVADPGDIRIQKAVRFLKEHQCKEAPGEGAWQREFHDEQGVFHCIPDLLRTSFAIQALIKAGCPVDCSPVKSSLDWLLSARHEDNGYSGWGFMPDAKIDILPTCFALMALLVAYKAGATLHRQPIEEGLKTLRERWRNNKTGSFGDSDQLEGIHTTYALLVFQFARKCELNPYNNMESYAISWLLENQDKARKPIEVKIAITSENQKGNYGFMFMCDALLLKVLMDSENHTTKLARDAMISLKEKRDSEGGFYGYRASSWSTARAISALVAAKNQDYTEFPEHDPEYVGMKTGNIILVFAVILAVMVTFLSARERFGLIQAVIFMGLMLASLMAYGSIGEKTFKELMANLFSRITNK